MKPMHTGSCSAILGLFLFVQGCASPLSSVPSHTGAEPSPLTKANWTVLLKKPENDSGIVPASASIPDPTPTTKDTPAPILTRESALDYALKHNPALALFRENRGMAAAGIVLAKIYPYNPIFQSHDLAVNGPTSAGITSHFFTENYSVLPLELNGQGRERQASAAATATRTEWEIAGQEIVTAIAVLRAYDTALYREQKLKVLEDTVTFSEQVLKQTRRLADGGRLGAADVLFASTELDAARAQIGQGRTALSVARADLQRQIGTLDDRIVVSGELDPPLPALDEKAVIPYALQHRPEIHARIAAVAEAEAQLRLQIADRFGNLAAGPRCDYTETRANFIGVVITGFIPIFNTRQGEIAQRRAGVSRAQVDLRTTEYLVKQSVEAAMSRLAEARKWASRYSDEVMPNLNKARKDIDKLFAQNEQGVDVLRVIGVQRNVLRAQDAYLDARFEVSQARLDLAAALGEPALATGAAQPSTEEPPQCGPALSPPASALSSPGPQGVSKWRKNPVP